MPKTKSGAYWVEWASTNAKNSKSVDDLDPLFKLKAKAFIKALEDAGATVKVSTTKRDAKRAYLFHWAWLIGLDKPIDHYRQRFVSRSKRDTNRRCC